MGNGWRIQRGSSGGGEVATAAEAEGEEEEEEEVLFIANAVNEEDSERNRATQV